MTSLVRIDGKPFRLMGKEPSVIPALRNTTSSPADAHDLFLRRRRRERDADFMTAALPENIDLLSRP